MNIKKERSEVLRADKCFSEMIKQIQAKKLMNDKRFVKSSRITKAIFNQYKKYPDIYKELEGADLK